MAANPETIQLYDGPAPGSEAWLHHEVTEHSPAWEDIVVRNVTRPTLTVVRPKAPNGTGIVVCPGGGFHGLSWGWEGVEVANWLAERGTTCFILKYRLIRCDGEPGQVMRAKSRADFARDIGVVVPLAAADGRRAIAMVRGRAAEFTIDPARVGIVGFSAGGTVAVSVAMTADPTSRPDFAAPIYPQYDWAHRQDTPSTAMPMFIACASDDEVGLAPHSVRLYQDWIAAGKPAELHMYSTGGHGFGMRKRGVPSDGWIDALGAWLRVSGFA
jgi:acetyl esterase/lipase